jgi:MFS family permease
VNRSVALLALAQAIVQSGSIHLTTTGALIGVVLTSSEAVSTWPASLHVIIALSMTMPASFIMSRLGRKRGFLIGFVLGLLGVLMAARGVESGSFFLFAAGAAAMGVLTAFGSYFRFAAVEAVDAENKSQAISLVLTGGVLAAFVGPYLSTWGAAAVPGSVFTGGYLLLLPMYALAVLIVLGLKFEKPIVVQVSIRKSFRDILREPAFLGVVFVGASAYLTMVLIMTATPLAMHREHMGLEATTQVIRAHLLGMFVPSFFTGSLIARFGARRIIITGALLFAACIGINFHGVSYWHYLVSLVLLGVGWNFLFVSASQMLTSVVRNDHMSAAQALNDFIIALGQASAIAITGKLHTLVGWQWLNVVTLPLIPAILLVGVYITSGRKRD